jgi:hypothetical protein
LTEELLFVAADTSHDDVWVQASCNVPKEHRLGAARNPIHATRRVDVQAKAHVMQGQRIEDCHLRILHCIATALVEQKIIVDTARGSRLREQVVRVGGGWNTRVVLVEDAKFFRDGVLNG